MPKLYHFLQIDPFDINSIVIVDISKCTGEPTEHLKSTQKFVSGEDFINSYEGHEMERMFEILEINGAFYSDTSEEFLGFSG